MISRSTAQALGMALLLLGASTAPALGNDERQAASLERGPATIAGSWFETTTIPGGPPPFAGLVTFDRTGTMVSSYQGNVNSGPNPTAWTASHGQWVHEGKRTYSTTSLQLVSDFSDNLRFVNKLRQRITLSRSGNTYTSVVRAEFYDPAGTLLFAVDATTEGQRIGVEPLP